jgi:hypothetical protein
MNLLKKIAGINLAVLFAYSILIRALTSGNKQDAAMGILVLSAFAIAVHFLICLVVTGFAFGYNNKALGRAWLWSSGIVLLVGFSTCLGNTYL